MKPQPSREIAIKVETVRFCLSSDVVVVEIVDIPPVATEIIISRWMMRSGRKVAGPSTGVSLSTPTANLDGAALMHYFSPY